MTGFGNDNNIANNSSNLKKKKFISQKKKFTYLYEYKRVSCMIYI